MRTFASLIAGIIIAGLLIASLGVPSFDGPYFDPKCSGDYCDVKPAPGAGHIHMEPLPAASHD
jgi:hypothetical protein